MDKQKQYFAIVGLETHHNPDWNKKDAIEWAKEIAEQGNKVKVFEGELIKQFDIEIKVIEKKLNNEVPSSSQG